MSVAKVGDTDLYYEERGTGSPILLIHPAGATASTWGEAFLDGLSAVGRVIAYDRRGYARSGGATAHSVVTHTADAAALLDTLHATPAVVVGTSAGATVALDLAVRRPDVVSAVVVHEAAWRAMRHPEPSGLRALTRMEWRARRGHYDEAAEVLLRWVYGYRDGGSAWDAFPAAWREIARQNGRSVVVDLRSSLRSYPSAGELASIMCPVTCTYGSRSRSYMRAVMTGLALAIPSASVREINRSAHAVSFDAPDNFVTVIRQATRSRAYGLR